MENEDEGNNQDQLEKHSLPGTNQAGKKSDSCGNDDHESKAGGSVGPQQDQLEKHSLPGTNQAGKGPASSETNDTAVRPNDR
jgi:hypothetical protein